MIRTLRLSATLIPLLAIQCTYWPEINRPVALWNAKAAIPEEDWRGMLSSLDTVQSAPDPDPEAAAEGLRLRALALDWLGREEESLANYRFLLRQFPESEAAKRMPEITRVEIELSPSLVAAAADSLATRVPASVLPVLRQPRAARDSGLRGEIEVRYRIGAGGGSEQIEVVGSPHPLLASLAAEAAANTRHAVGKDAVAGEAVVARYRFPIVDIPPRLGHAYQAYAFDDCVLVAQHLDLCDACDGYWEPHRELLRAHCAELSGEPSDVRKTYARIARRHPDTYPGQSAKIRLAELDAPAGDSPAGTGDAPRLVRRQPHNYPSALFGSNIEGWVLVRFDVDDWGAVDAIRVVASEPPYLFDSVAVDAVKLWRYAHTPARDVQVRLDFAMP